MKPQMATKPKWSGKGSGTTFAFIHTASWQMPVIVDVNNQNPFPLHIDGAPDAPASCSWNLTLTYNGQQLEV